MAGQTISFKVQVLTTQAQQAIKNLEQYLKILEKQISMVTDKKSPQWRKLNSEINSVNSSIKTLNSSMTKLNGTAKTSGNMFMNITRYFTSFLLVQQVTNAIRKATSAFVDFQKTIAMNSALLQGGKKDMESMKNQALELGKTTVFTANQVAELQTQLIKLGVTTVETLEPMTKSVVNLAAAAGEDLATAGSVVYSVLNQYQISAIHATEVSDIMAKSLVESAMDLNSLSYSLKYAGTSANMLGLTLAQTTAMLELLSNLGIKGSSAGTSLNAMFIEMTKSSSKLTKATGIVVKDFNDIIKTFQSLDSKGIKAAEMFDLLNIRAARAAGNMTDPQMIKKLEFFLAGLGDPDTIKKLTEEYKKLSTLTLDPVKDAVSVKRLEDLTRALFEVNSAGEVIILNGEKVQKSLDGYASDTSSKAINSVAGDLQLLTSNLTNLGIEIMNSKNGPIRDFVQGLTDVVNGLRYFITGVGESSDKIQKWITILYELGKAWVIFYASSKISQFSIWAATGIKAIGSLSVKFAQLTKEVYLSAVGVRASSASIKFSLASISLAWKTFWTGLKASNPLGWILLLIDGLVLAGKALVKLFQDAEKAKARAERKENRNDINGMISDYDKLIKKNQQAYDDRSKLNLRQKEDLKRSLEEEIALREDLDAKIRQLAQDKLKDDQSYQVFLATENRIKNDKMLSGDQEYYDKNKALNDQKLKDAEKLAADELKVKLDWAQKDLNITKDHLQMVGIEVKDAQKSIDFLDPANIDPDTGKPGSTPTVSAGAGKGTSNKFTSPGLGLNESKKWEDNQLRLLDVEAKIAEARRQAQQENDNLVKDAYDKRKEYYDYEVRLINLVITDVEQKTVELGKLRVKYEELETKANKDYETASSKRKSIFETDVKLNADMAQEDIDNTKRIIREKQTLLETEKLLSDVRSTVPVSDLDKKGVVGQFKIQAAEIRLEMEEVINEQEGILNSAREKILVNQGKVIADAEQYYLDFAKSNLDILNTELTNTKLTEDQKSDLRKEYAAKLVVEEVRKDGKIISIKEETTEKEKELNRQKDKAIQVSADQTEAKLDKNLKEYQLYIDELLTSYENAITQIENNTKRGPNIGGKLKANSQETSGKLADVDKQQAEALKDLGSAKMLELGMFKKFDDMKTKIVEEGEKKRSDIIMAGIEQYAGAVQESISIMGEMVSTQKQMQQDTIDATYEKEIKRAEDTKDNLIKQYGLKNKKEEQMTANQKRKLEKITLQAEEAREKAEKKKEEDNLALKKKFADKEFAITVANIVINTGLGVMKAIAQFGPVVGGIMSGLVVALGATQISAAKKQRDSIKSLEKGGEVFGPSHRHGGVKVELEGGEVVVNKKSAAIPWVKKMALNLNAVNNHRTSTGRIMADGGQVRTSAVSQNVGIDEDTLRMIVRETVLGVSEIPVVNNTLDTTGKSNNVRKVINRTTW